jgi:hypothetical protein
MRVGFNSAMIKTCVTGMRILGTLVFLTLAACSGAETEPKAELKNDRRPLSTVKVYGADVTLEQALAVKKLCELAFYMGTQAESRAGGEWRYSRKSTTAIPYSAQAIDNVVEFARENDFIWFKKSVPQLLVSAELLRSVPVPNEGKIIFARKSKQTTLAYVLTNEDGSPQLKTCHEESKTVLEPS